MKLVDLTEQQRANTYNPYYSQGFQIHPSQVELARDLRDSLVLRKGASRGLSKNYPQVFVNSSHRRFGKSINFLKAMSAAGMVREGFRAAIIVETYRAGDLLFWNAVDPVTRIDMLSEVWPEFQRFRDPGGRSSKTDKPMRIWWGKKSSLTVLSSRDLEVLTGTGLDCVFIDEFQNQDKRIFNKVVTPVTKGGGHVLVGGTVRGRYNHQWQLTEQARLGQEAGERVRSYRYTVKETGMLSEEQVEEDIRKWALVMGRENAEMYAQQEYFCNPDIAVVGSVFAKEMLKVRQDGRIGDFKYDPNRMVFTSWDIGTHRPTVIWFWQIADNGDIIVIDYFEGKHMNFESLAPILRNKPWGENYGLHILPHDGANKYLSAQGDLAQVLATVGIRPCVILVGEWASNADERRSLIAKYLGRTKFNDIKEVRRGISCLDNHRVDFVDELGVWKTKPVEDWTNDATDSAGYFYKFYPKLLEMFVNAVVVAAADSLRLPRSINGKRSAIINRSGLR